VQSGYNGAGFTVAIVGDYPPSSTDLSAYLAQFGIQTTGTYQIENVDGGSQMNDQEGLLEATLDVETVMALAPGANIIFYSMPDASGISFLDDVSQIVSDQKANVASASYGGCEDPSDVTVMQPIFAQAMNEKMAWVASSGDQGDRCTSTSPTGVVYPASDPNVIGVGGTQTSSKITSTKVWNDDVGASGGGISALFSLPQYQNGLSGEASTTFRNVPDVAMPAVFDEIYFQGQWSDVDGTSWGAPQVAALIAEIDEYCNSALRDPVDIFYYALAGKGYADFSDVITGNNQYDADATFYSAQPGFDNVSGIGIPLGMPVAQTVCPNRIPALSRFRRSLAFAAPLSAAARGVPNIAGLGDRGKRASAAATRIAIVLQPAANLAQNEQSVIASLRSNGFTVTHASRNHLVIDAEAPASVVARYFGTELHDFDQPSYGVRYANVTPIALPSAIAPYVQGLLANDLVLDGSRPHRVRGF
jgi:subtilase family serine protease